MSGNIFIKQDHFNNHVCWLVATFLWQNLRPAKRVIFQIQSYLHISVFQQVEAFCELSIMKYICDKCQNGFFQVSFFNQLMQMLCLLILFEIYIHCFVYFHRLTVSIYGSLKKSFIENNWIVDSRIFPPPLKILPYYKYEGWSTSSGTGVIKFNMYVSNFAYIRPNYQLSCVNWTNR